MNAIVSDFYEQLATTAHEVEQALDAYLPVPQDAEARVHEAMRYAVLNGGKRLRPFFVIQGARLFGVKQKAALCAAAAVECIHGYSLVHDDLPCMDDDDLRRGKPTVHIKFDEATAVLAGDGLLTLAFEILMDEDAPIEWHVRCDLTQALARAAGAHGMIGGQMIDLRAENKLLDIGEITRLQQLKTGALIAFSCEAGAILGKASKAERHALHAYAHDIGLAFQIADDLLDAEGSEEDLGKKVGKDADAGKATFVSLMGLEEARAHAEMLADQAVRHLDMFGAGADTLRQAAQFIVSRRN